MSIKPGAIFYYNSIVLISGTITPADVQKMNLK